MESCPVPSHFVTMNGLLREPTISDFFKNHFSPRASRNMFLRKYLERIMAKWYRQIFLMAAEWLRMHFKSWGIFCQQSQLSDSQTRFKSGLHMLKRAPVHHNINSGVQGLLTAPSTFSSCLEHCSPPFPGPHSCRLFTAHPASPFLPFLLAAITSMASLHGVSVCFTLK